MIVSSESGGTKRFHRKTSTLLTEINVTPFVDVMLVLLIIFMVTAPLLSSGIDIDLPEEDSGYMNTDGGTIIKLRADGSYLYNDKHITQKALISQLKNLQATSAKAEVYLEAHKKLDYATVMKAMTLIKKAGIERLGLVTDPPR